MHPALQRVAAWLRAGYPQGIPDADYVPLLAILRRRLSEEETRELGDQLVRDGIVPADRIDVGVGFLKITDELASESEVKRVSPHFFLPSLFSPPLLLVLPPPSLHSLYACGDTSLRNPPAPARLP